MCRRADRDDTRLPAIPGTGGQRLVEPEGEPEVAEMVGGELQFAVFRRPGQTGCDDTRVIDQQVQRPVPALPEAIDRTGIREVQRGDVQSVVAGRGGQILGHRRTGVCVADREGDLRAGAGERADRLEADAR